MNLDQHLGGDGLGRIDIDQPEYLRPPEFTDLYGSHCVATKTFFNSV